MARSREQTVTGNGDEVKLPGAPRELFFELGSGEPLVVVVVVVVVRSGSLLTSTGRLCTLCANLCSDCCCIVAALEPMLFDNFAFTLDSVSLLLDF